jgi:hypothetical protein
MFDHKSVKLDFSTKNCPSRHFINPSIFSHPRFDAVVAVATVETYLHHAVVGQQGLDLDVGLQHVADIIALIKIANDLEFEISFSGQNDNLELQLANTNAGSGSTE